MVSIIYVYVTRFSNERNRYLANLSLGSFPHSLSVVFDVELWYLVEIFHIFRFRKTSVLTSFLNSFICAALFTRGFLA